MLVRSRRAAAFAIGAALLALATACTNPTAPSATPPNAAQVSSGDGVGAGSSGMSPDGVGAGSSGMSAAGVGAGSSNTKAVICGVGAGSSGC
ncbi:MAG TPA: hypothetical protein VK807_18590 [Gemmatimonadaceae bacterium]|nr:hypothetical protein [Gemmatimonadaceae bacterium]